MEKDLQTNSNNAEYKKLFLQISQMLSSGRQKAAAAVNSVLVETYWNIGKYIVEFEQSGSKKAKYGDELLIKLSKDLTRAFGKGFSRSNLTYIRKLYLTFPKCETLSHILTWSHYFEILKADSELEIGFYAKECEKENWKHHDVGQMNMYLNYFKSEKMSEGDNPPIGIILGTYKDKLLMEYATQGIDNNLFVSKYQLYLPNKQELQKELEKLLDGDLRTREK